jgi:hypothetical protein
MSFHAARPNTCKDRVNAITHISDTDKRPLAFVAQGRIELRSSDCYHSVAPC